MPMDYRTETGWMCICDHCGKRFENKKRMDGATYCTTAHRVAAGREREALKRRLIDFQIEAVQLIQLWKEQERKGGGGRTKTALERVAKTISSWNTLDPSTHVVTLALDRNPFRFDDLIAESATDD